MAFTLCDRCREPGVFHAMRFWIVLYAIGAMQAAMLALALWRRPANPEANRVLSAWLGLIAVDLAVKAMHMASPQAGLADAFRIARLLPFAYAPLFFLYARTLVTGRAPRWRDLWHGAWLGLMLAWMTVQWLAGTPLSADGDWRRSWFDPLLFSIAFAYLGAGAWQVQRYRRWLRTRRSDADRLSLRWLVAMTLCQCVIWGIAAAHAVLDLGFVDYFLIYAAVAAWVCLIGWFSLGQPPVAEPLQATPAPTAVVEEAAAGDDPRFDAVEARLSALMAGQALYREPALGIAQLARRSGYPEYLVSAVINRRLGGNFCEYVNVHRIEATRAALADPADARTILDIAYDAGFTAKSTFNTAFKRVVGETPSAYRRRHARSGDLPAPD